MNNKQIIKSTFLFSFFCFLSFSVLPQQKDTLRIMSYNLLNYRNYPTGCTVNNNSPTAKERNLDSIISYTLPDILVVNEIGLSDPVATFRLVSGALNQNGRTYYGFTNIQSGNLQNIRTNQTGNLIYWDTRKLELKSSQYIEFDPFNRALVRVIDHFTLYYKDPNLAIHGDTIFLNIFAAHLKAGTNSSDTAQRNWGANAIMNYINLNNINGNNIIAGDLNIYRASEPAFQTLVNNRISSIRFYDPTLPNNPSFNWSNNSSFAGIHTQSTRTAGGCGAGGGMDDRFDFILASAEVMNGLDSVKYINNSYTSYGQDGLRFNASITSPTNTSVSATIANALEDLSDHLPVYLDLEISLPRTTGVKEISNSLEVKYNNPFESVLNIYLINKENNTFNHLEILDINGIVLYKTQVMNRTLITVNTEQFLRNIYFLRITDKTGLTTVKKLIKI